MMVGKVVEIVAGAILAKEDGDPGALHYFIAGPGPTRAFVMREVNGFYGFELVLLTREGKQFYCELSNVRAL